MRPEFQATVKAKKKNPVTQNYEPHMRSMERCVRVMSSLIFIVFLVCMSLQLSPLHSYPKLCNIHVHVLLEYIYLHVYFWSFLVDTGLFIPVFVMIKCIGQNFDMAMALLLCIVPSEICSSLHNRYGTLVST